ncbi:MAG: 4Fe-4S binding protein [Firmicutes bacterium]|nr:4Fe-4S binding protein [Bacillota bacterium]
MAVRLREPEQAAAREIFAPTDPAPGWELSRFRPIRRALKSRLFQFLAILPNQVIFWLVILTGVLGAADPTRNFATVITWYIWFAAVFLLMVGVGRGWCLMCPFGGLAEWVQRLSLWRRHPRALTLGRRWSRTLSRYGLIPSLIVFVVLTWFEEFFNIAGPGRPVYTSYLVFFIIALALVTFLVFERRTFCRYLCPLSGLIGTVGSTGMVAGFRTRNRNTCLTCPTKDCMRGSERGYGCPWYEWPGSASSNLMCGLCSECFKNCPYDNVGLYLQPPLTSVVKPVRRRWDIAVVALGLLGIVVFQQVNALAPYAPVDAWLNRTLHFPGYPNPVDYVGIVALTMAAVVGYVAGLRAVFARPSSGLRAVGAAVSRPLARAARWQALERWLTPLSYGLIPVIAADYLARQLPKLCDHALRIVPAISDPFDLGWNLFGTAHSHLYSVRLLPTSGVVHVQMAVMALGTIGSLYATRSIVRRDLSGEARRPRFLTAVALAFVAAVGVALMLLYAAMGGAE